MENVIKRMRWKAYFFINGDSKRKRRRTDLNQRNTRPKQKSQICLKKICLNVFIPADETKNLYKLTPKEYKTLLRNNVTKEEKASNIETKKIAKTSTWTIVLSALQKTMHLQHCKIINEMSYQQYHAV